MLLLLAHNAASACCCCLLCCEQFPQFPHARHKLSLAFVEMPFTPACARHSCFKNMPFRGLGRNKTQLLFATIVSISIATLACAAGASNSSNINPKFNTTTLTLAAAGIEDFDTSQACCHTSHVTRHTSKVTRLTSHITRLTSHVTHHTSHLTHALTRNASPAAAAAHRRTCGGRHLRR